MNNDTREKVLQEFGYTLQYLYEIMSFITVNPIEGLRFGVTIGIEDCYPIVRIEEYAHSIGGNKYPATRHSITSISDCNNIKKLLSHKALDYASMLFQDKYVWDESKNEFSFAHWSMHGRIIPCGSDYEVKIYGIIKGGGNGKFHTLTAAKRFVEKCIFKAYISYNFDEEMK